MNEKRWLYFALGVTTVISIGAVTNQLAPLAAATGLELNGAGITFPDGTVQTSAAMNPSYAAQESIIHGCSVALTEGEAYDSCSFYQVPVGKILSAEFMSGALTVPSGQGAAVELTQTTTSGFFTHHKLIHDYQYQNLNGDYQYNVSQPIRLYLDEENTLNVRVRRGTTTGDNVTGEFWITGYYVDKLP